MTTKRSLTFAFRVLLLLTAVALAAAAGARTARPSTTTLPAGNTVEQWDKIAEDTVVGSGRSRTKACSTWLTSRPRSTTRVSLTAAATPLLPNSGSRHASLDAAVVEAAYRTLSHYFPALRRRSTRSTRRRSPRSRTAGRSCREEDRSGRRRPVIRRADRRRPDHADRINLELPNAHTGPGRVAADAAATAAADSVARQRQTVPPPERHPVPAPPAPALSSAQWVAAFDELKSFGGATSTARTPDQTTSRILDGERDPQYNGRRPSVTDARRPELADSRPARRDGQRRRCRRPISVMHAKYHYLFWRPVTAIDPTSVSSRDGFGPAPGSTTATRRPSSSPAGGPC